MKISYFLDYDVLIGLFLRKGCCIRSIYEKIHDNVALNKASKILYRKQKLFQND